MESTSSSRQRPGSRRLEDKGVGCCPACDGWAARAAHRALTSALHRTLIDMYNARRPGERDDHHSLWDLASAVDYAIELLERNTADADADVHAPPHLPVTAMLRDTRPEQWGTVVDEAQARARELLEEMGWDAARMTVAKWFAHHEQLDSTGAVAIATLFEIIDGPSE